MSGDNLAKHARNLTFKGFSHPIRTSHSGLSLLDYVVLDTDGLSWELRPCYRIEMETDMVHFLGQSIHFPGSGPPKTDSSCWFTQGIICGGGGRYTHTQAFISFTRSTDLQIYGYVLVQKFFPSFNRCGSFPSDYFLRLGLSTNLLFCCISLFYKVKSCCHIVLLFYL